MHAWLKKIFSYFKGNLVGEDVFGNRYYTERGNHPTKKRWVIYKGMTEASKIPAEWHGWLHYTHEQPIIDRPRYSWLKKHLPNLSGTPFSYRPKGHLLKEGELKKIDYEPWQPK